MRPSTRFALPLLLLAPALFGWVKQGTVSGNITDVEVIAWNGSSGLVYAATGGSGVYESFDGVSWTEANGSGSATLPELQVKALASFPGQQTWLVAACQHGVYITFDRGGSWSDFNQGLSTPFPLMDIAVSSYGGQYCFYLATLGDGIFRRTGTPWGTNWGAFNGGTIGSNEERLAVSVGANGGRALAGFTKGTGPGNQGHLYWLDYGAGSNVWATVTNTSFPQNVSIPAISFRFSDYALVSLGDLGTGAYGGVWTTTSATFPTFTPLYPSNGMPLDQPFLSLDFVVSGSTFGAAGGTSKGVWSLPKPGSSGSYARLPFKGAVTGVGVGNPEDCDLFFGGPGKGPFLTDLCTPSSKPSVRRQDMNDYQVNDIAVSRGFGVAGDYGVFAASRIAGLYKNQSEPLNPCSLKGGYFIRMAGDPSQESAPDLLCLGISPIYKEGGAIENWELTLFAGTNGKGVLRTIDGGRSWSYINSGLTGDAIVTALAVSPRFGVQDLTVYAAVYGRGVYVSEDGGGTWTLTGVAKGLDNHFVNTLAIHPWYNTDYPFVYAGCRAYGTQQTFYYYRRGSDSWYSSGNLYATINSLALGLRGGALHLYAGTVSFGVWSSFDGGASWQDWNLSTLAGQDIVQVAASPDYDANTLVLATVRPASSTGPGGVYWWSSNGPSVWSPFNQGLPDRRVLSVAFDPHFTSEGVIFCGHATQRLYAGYLRAAAGPRCEWLQATGFYTTPKRINGVAVDPGDPDLILAATDDMGAFLSFDGGFTFRPWSYGLYYTDLSDHVRVIPRTTAASIVQPPGGTTRNALLGTDGHGIRYNTYDPALATSFTSSWATASMSPATTGVINEIRVTPEKVLLNETFALGIPSTWTVVNGGTTPSPPSWTWRTDNPCGRGIASPLSAPVAVLDSDCEGSGKTQDDSLITPVLLTSTAGINTLTLEFDHYYQYCCGSYGYVDLYRPSTGTWTNLAAYATTLGPGHVTLTLTSYLEPGLKVRFRYTGSFAWYWQVDNVKVTANKAEDIRASDTINGDYASSNYGVSWSQVAGIPAGVGLSDINFMDSAPITLGRGKTGFVWGCSSGKSLSFRASCTGNGKAWSYNPLAAAWSACSTTGLDTCEDFRAILKTSAGPILMGSIGTGSGGSWVGMYRSDDSCSTWTASNEGLPINPMIYALQELPNGDILAGVVDSYLGDGDQGGVYLSDAASGGRAWVRYSAGFSATPGTMEIAAGGSTIYTGMSEDGIYAESTTLAYSGAPTAYFSGASQVCEDTSTSFTDYSAGYPTGWSWTFGDGGSSSSRNPSHSYANPGDYTVTLTASNTHGSDPYSAAIKVLGELDVANTLRVSKGTLYLNENFSGGIPGTWTLVNGGSAWTWRTDNPCGRTIGAPLSTPFALIDSDCEGGTATQADELITPAMNTSAASAVTLEFDHYFWYYAGGPVEHGYVRVRSSATGGGWVQVADYTGQNYGPAHVSLNLTAYKGTSFQVEFYYTGGYDYLWAVDNVKVWDSASTAALLTWTDLNQGETGYQAWASNSASSGAPYGSLLGPNVTTTTVTGYTYFRIQPKSTGYICGDGLVGGSW